MHLNASFSPIFPPAGHVAFSSQSGALGLAILALAAERQSGLSTFVSVGNKADVSGNDLLQYWEDDPATSTSSCCTSNRSAIRAVSRAWRDASGRRSRSWPSRPGGRGPARRAAGSHTAALAASDVAVDALFHQAGVIRADTIDEMFDVAACLDASRCPAGRRVAIVTNAGGPGILAVDACEGAGLTVAEFSDATRARLAAFLPAVATSAIPWTWSPPPGPTNTDGASKWRSQPRRSMRSSSSSRPWSASRSAEILAGIREGHRRRPARGRGREQAGPGVPDGRSRTSAPASRSAENACRPTRFPRMRHERSARSRPMPTWRAQTAGIVLGLQRHPRGRGARVCREIVDGTRRGLADRRRAPSGLSAFGLPMVPGALLAQRRRSGGAGRGDGLSGRREAEFAAARAQVRHGRRAT